MNWSIHWTGKAFKQRQRLPAKPRNILPSLEKALKNGPHLSTKWRYFKKTAGVTDCYHCHLCSGRTTYVAIWRADRKMKTIEIRYVGTHEGAGNYRIHC